MKGKSTYIGALAIALLTLAAGVAITLALSANRDKGEGSKQQGDTKAGLSLPNLNKIDSAKNPMLYDFVNSSISYRMNVDVSKYGFYYALLRDGDYPKTLYLEYYSYPEKLTFPSLGTKPVKVDLNDWEVASIKEAASKMSNSRVFSEGNWTMFVVSQYAVKDSENQFDHCDGAGRWAGLDLEKLSANPKRGEMYTTIRSGLGWPTAWLRKDPYSETVKIEGYNPFDPFWNSHNIRSYRIYTNRKTGKTLKVEIDQLDRFKFKVNGYYVYVNQAQLKEYLKKEGWE